MSSGNQSWWARVSIGSKVGFDKAWQAVDKLGAPVNKLSNKLGSEAFWPSTLDKESDKAARILRSFCKDGFYHEETMPSPSDGPKPKQKVLKKIPQEVIRNAKGLAIFTTMRTGLWVSGAGGSGVLVGRTADGGWSPPSGIMLHTAGLGFLVGVDIYDCVVVLNTQQALDAFSKIRCTLGGEISAVAGPVGAGGMLETELHKRQAPVFTYLKSRGFYAGVQIDGTVVVERTDENERFYGERIPVGDILAGRVRHPPIECRGLLETIKAAQGDSDVDQKLLPSAPPPSDLDVHDSSHVFGIPAKEDPDPYGVLALEKEGMTIRQAGTQERASWEHFNFQPSPTSPIFSAFSRPSIDTLVSKEKRDSRHRSSSRLTQEVSGGEVSTASTAVEQAKEQSRRTSVAPSMTNMSTQTEPEPTTSPPMSPHINSGRSSRHNSIQGLVAHDATPSPRPIIIRQESSHSSIPSPQRSSFRSSHTRNSSNGSHSRAESPPQQLINTHKDIPEEDEHKEPSSEDEDDNLSDTDLDLDSEDDDTQIVVAEPVVHSIRKITAPQFVTRARMVQVPKRITPVLPPRNPNRSRGGPLVIDGNNNQSSSPTSATSATSDSTTESPLKSKPDWSVPNSPTKDGLTVEGAAELGTPSPSPGEERNPWGNILEKHKHESRESFDMPGAFHSLPPTPDETRAGAHASS